MGISAKVYVPERARLLTARDNASTPAAAKAEIDAAVANLDAALWERVRWTPRCAYGCAIGADGYAYITGGWNGNSSNQAHYGDIWRTKDFMIAERARGVSYSPGRSYAGAAFIGDKLFVGPGYDNHGASNCTRKIFGAVPGDPMVEHEQTSCYEHEAGMFHRHSDGKVYIAGGLRYTGTTPPLAMIAESFRSPDFGGNLELRSSNLGLNRRNFGAVSWDGALWMLGGRDDNANPATLASAMKSTDGLQSISQAVATLPFGQRYAFGCCVFKGRVTVGFGIDGSGNPVDDLWSSDDPDLVTWTQHSNPGIGARSLVSLIPLVIDGVETLGVINGYNGTNAAKTDVYITTDHDTAWMDFAGSDFAPD